MGAIVGLREECKHNHKTWVTSKTQSFVEILFSYAQGPISTIALHSTGYVAILNKLYHVLASKITLPNSNQAEIPSKHSSDIAIPAPSHASFVFAYRDTSTTTSKLTKMTQKQLKGENLIAGYQDSPKTPLIRFFYWKLKERRFWLISIVYSAKLLICAQNNLKGRNVSKPPCLNDETLCVSEPEP